MPNLYSDFITQLRADTGDFALRRYETADGDGSTSVFQLAHPKILESSYTVKVGGVTKTEVTHYTINKDVGQIVFTSGNIPASGSENVSFEYQSVNLLNADWLNILNQILQQLRKKLWIEVVNSTALTTVADQAEYSLSGIASEIIYVLEADYRTSSTERWTPIATQSEVVFYKDLQQIHLKKPFDTAGYAMRFRVLRAYAQGDETTDTFEPQKTYWPVLQKFCHAEYLIRRAMEMSKEISAISKEKTFETMGEMMKLAAVLKQEARTMLKEIRPSRPAISIPFAIKA